MDLEAELKQLEARKKLIQARLQRQNQGNGISYKEENEHKSGRTSKKEEEHRRNDSRHRSSHQTEYISSDEEGHTTELHTGNQRGRKSNRTSPSKRSESRSRKHDFKRKKSNSPNGKHHQKLITKEFPPTFPGSTSNTKPSSSKREKPFDGKQKSTTQEEFPGSASDAEPPHSSSKRKNSDDSDKKRQRKSSTVPPDSSFKRKKNNVSDRKRQQKSSRIAEEFPPTFPGSNVGPSRGSPKRKRPDPFDKERVHQEKEKSQLIVEELSPTTVPVQHIAKKKVPESTSDVGPSTPRKLSPPRDPRRGKNVADEQNRGEETHQDTPTEKLRQREIQEAIASILGPISDDSDFEGDPEEKIDFCINPSPALIGPITLPELSSYPSLSTSVNDLFNPLQPLLEPPILTYHPTSTNPCTHSESSSVTITSQDPRTEPPTLIYQSEAPLPTSSVSDHRPPTPQALPNLESTQEVSPEDQGSSQPAFYSFSTESTSKRNSTEELSKTKRPKKGNEVVNIRSFVTHQFTPFVETNRLQYEKILDSITHLQKQIDNLLPKLLNK